MEHITKGKWVIIVTRDKDNWPAYSLQSMNNPTNPIEVEANRQLIESAPKIIEQRDKLLTACEVAVLALTHEPVNPDDIEFIKAAIAKAIQ